MTQSRRQPQYHFERVEALPPDEAARGMRYHNILSKLMGDPGSTYLIATFATDSGATVVKKDLESERKKKPAGKWQFDVRRVTEKDESGEPTRVSKLYATYHGPE